MAKRPNGSTCCGVFAVHVLRLIVAIVEVAVDVEEMVEDQEKTTTHVETTA